MKSKLIVLILALLFAERLTFADGREKPDESKLRNLMQQVTRLYNLRPRGELTTPGIRFVNPSLLARVPKLKKMKLSPIEAESRLRQGKKVLVTKTERTADGDKHILSTTVLRDLEELTRFFNNDPELLSAPDQEEKAHAADKRAWAERKAEFEYIRENTSVRGNKAFDRAWRAYDKYGRELDTYGALLDALGGYSRSVVVAHFFEDFGASVLERVLVPSAQRKLTTVEDVVQ